MQELQERNATQRAAAACGPARADVPQRSLQVRTGASARAAGTNERCCRSPTTPNNATHPAPSQVHFGEEEAGRQDRQERQGPPAIAGLQRDTRGRPRALAKRHQRGGLGEGGRPAAVLVPTPAPPCVRRGRACGVQLAKLVCAAAWACWACTKRGRCPSAAPPPPPRPPTADACTCSE